MFNISFSFWFIFVPYSNGVSDDKVVDRCVLIYYF
jgi:hypothetical protein